MRYLTLAEILLLHRRILEDSGGAAGLLNLGALESAVHQPRMTFQGEELYKTLDEKAAALGYSIIMNHAFMDGNKRIAHAAIEVFLILNGCEFDVPVDDAERFVLDLAAGKVPREDLVSWIESHREER